MAKNYQLMIIFVFMAVLVTSIPLQAVYGSLQPGFSPVKKATGIIMKFCINEAYTLQECQERYRNIGWTDRVHVLIYAPGWNDDSDKIDRIGTATNPIDVYTDDHRVNNIDFSETGPDTGVFMGVVKLTGEMMWTVHDTFLSTVRTPGMSMSPGILSSHDRAVMIGTNTQDGRLTVAWEANEDTIVQKSGYYNWRIGEAHFDKEAYDINEKVTFFIRDADLWKHHREFFTNYVRVYSDTDMAGIHVGVQFVKNMDHGSGVDDGIEDIHLTEPAASSLTKYTPDGKWKTYFWWEPGGVLGVDQEYDLNLMAHDGLTDIHEMGLSYDMEIFLNGKLIDKRTDQFWVDGQGVEPVKFDERGSAKIVFSNIMDGPGSINFSFQVAPEAILKEVVPKHHSFVTGSIPQEFVGYEHPHYYDYLPGEFYMTDIDSSQSQQQLRVSHGDTIYVKYRDMTLPKPYSENEDTDIITRAIVLDTGVGVLQSAEAEIYVETPKTTITPVSADIKIPGWIKQNAAWWSDVQINDDDFAKGLEYLVQEQIIDIPPVDEIISEDEVPVTSIPLWVKNNASWWSEGVITDVEFANGIKYLIVSGLIQV